MGFEQLKAEYIDNMGDDLSVVNAARVSFDKQHKEFQDNDKGLINYLARHGHWTPFAHTAITLRISAPIFVRSQLFKHKVGLVENEISRRYVDSDPEFYVPYVWRGRPKNKKQGSGDPIPWFSDGYGKRNTHPTFEVSCYADISPKDWFLLCGDYYEKMVNEGVAPEQARMVLPQSMMTQWFWTGNVASFARVYGLRYAEDAQAETGEVARKIGEIMERLYPVSWEALTNYD